MGAFSLGPQLVIPPPPPIGNHQPELGDVMAARAQPGDNF